MVKMAILMVTNFYTTNTESGFDGCIGGFDGINGGLGYDGDLNGYCGGLRMWITIMSSDGSEWRAVVDMTACLFYSQESFDGNDDENILANNNNN